MLENWTRLHAMRTALGVAATSFVELSPDVVLARDRVQSTLSY
jgi:hypothetical protein